MAVTHDMWKQILNGNTLGRARKNDSDIVMDATFDEDIQYQVAYFYDYSHDVGEERFKLDDLHPSEDLNKIPIDIKFIRHASQTYNMDAITFWIQFRPSVDKNIIPYYDDILGKNKYQAIWPVGMYVDIMAEDGKYNKWLVVNTANYWQNQFPTWEVLKCDYVLQWIHRGKKCECPGVLQNQNSQIVRFTLETVYRKFLNCWEDSFRRVNQHRSRNNPKRSTSKVRQVPENGNHLSRNDMVLMCSNLIGDYEKIYLNIVVNRQEIRVANRLVMASNITITVFNILISQRRNKYMSKKLEFTQEQLDQIYDLYVNKGCSFKELIEIFGHSQTGFTTLFKDKGWPIHSRDYRQMKYHFDEHVFDIFDSNEKAFCLGLLLADGCNHYNCNQVSIELQSRDVGVLEGMQKVFKSDHKLLFTDASKYKTRKQDTYKLILYSKYFSDRCTEIGFIPRKSLILDFPYWLDQKYIPALLNGYIAGDGWVQKYVIGFMSTDKFCAGAKEYLDSIGIKSTIMSLKRHYDERTKELYINGKENISKLANLMYKNLSICLERKRDKLIEYGYLDKSIICNENNCNKS